MASINEAKTRQEIINLRLLKAGLYCTHKSVQRC